MAERLLNSFKDDNLRQKCNTCFFLVYFKLFLNFFIHELTMLKQIYDVLFKFN